MILDLILLYGLLAFGAFVFIGKAIALGNNT